VAIYNLGTGTGADAYAGDNTAVINTVSGTFITLNAAKQFPVESPGQRFFTLPATSTVYLCLNANAESGDGTGTLYQYSNALGSTPASCPHAAPGNATIIASNVSACAFSYAAGVGTRQGVAAMTLGLTKNNESVQLYREAHVDNVP